MSTGQFDREPSSGSLFVSVRIPHEPISVPAARARKAPSPLVVATARRSSATAANWIGWIGLPLYFAFLMAMAYAPDSGSLLTVPDFSMHRLWTADGLLQWTAFLAGAIALGAGRFAPLGLLVALALPRRRRWVSRILFVGAPSAILGTALSAMVLYSDSARTGSGDLFFACAFAAFGAWVGVTWLRGWSARFLLLPKLAGMALLIGLMLGGSLYASLQAEPFESDSHAVTSETTRRIYKLFRGKNPKSLERGEIATLRLSDRDLNEVLSWSTATMLGAPGLAQVKLAEDHPYVLISAASPVARGRARYLNAIVGGGMQFAGGRFALDLRRLRLGNIEVPQFMLAAVSPALTSMVNTSRQLRPFLLAIESLKVNEHDVVAVYGHADLPPGAVASLFEGDAIEELRIAVRAHTAHLLESDAQQSAADQRFGASLEAAFRFARERSKNGDARVENQAAILALGMLLGHSRVEQLVGSVMDPAQHQAARAFTGATLREREDWTHHFFVSAAISVLSSQGISDGVGIFKEELDSDGGSGFSFGDLLADRAGVTFAHAATQDKTSAHAMQERLARGYRVDDFMPSGADLPENMQQDEFKVRFGGVGGTGYRRLVDDIERRLAACAAYRDTVAPRAESSSN